MPAPAGDGVCPICCVRSSSGSGVMTVVQVGAVSSTSSDACVECRRVGALHLHVVNRRFPEELDLALNEAARVGYYALPTRNYDPTSSNKYDAAVDREGDLWQVEENDSEDEALEEDEVRQAEAEACLVECQKMSRAVQRFQNVKKANPKKNSSKVGVTTGRKRKIVGGGDGKVQQNKSVGVGLLGKGKAKKVIK